MIVVYNENVLSIISLLHFSSFTHLTISTHNSTINIVLLQLSYITRIWAHIYQYNHLVHLHPTNFNPSFFFSISLLQLLILCFSTRVQNGNTKTFVVDFFICLQNGIVDYTSLLARVRKERLPIKKLKGEQEPHVYCCHILHFRYF